MIKYKFIPKTTAIKSCTKKELCVLLEVTYPVLEGMLQAIEDKLGKPIKRQFSVTQVKLIIETYGLPGEIIGEIDA